MESPQNQLLARQDELRKRLQAIEADVRHDKEPLSKDWSEQAVEKENDEVLDQLGNTAQTELVQISNALTRIDSGEYGVCTSCGNEIGEARLNLLPYTDLCVRCSERKEAAQ